jgi:hypothetical protein
MGKNKLILLLFLLFSIEGLHAQALDVEINGTLIDAPQYKCVYLANLKQKTFLVTPIVKGGFGFKTQITVDGSLAHLFFDTDSTRTIDYLLQSRNGDHTRLVAIEDATLAFTANAKAMEVIKGPLNNDVNDMYEAMATSAFEKYFETHSESAVSLVFLRALIAVGSKNKGVTPINCKVLYDKLSERLKNSSKGKELLSLLQTTKTE